MICSGCPRAGSERHPHTTGPYIAKRHSAFGRAGKSGHGWRGLGGSIAFIPGLGCPATRASWGVMIEEARDLSTLQSAPHALIFPGLAIALTVLAFNFIGDGLREYLDPRQRSR